MNIVPKAGPAVLTPPTASSTPTAVERAVAKFNAGLQTQSQEHPVANANKVSAEEMSAIKAPSKQEDAGQTDTIEATEEAAKPEVKEEDTLSSRYALIARREKAIRAKDLELKARESAIKAKEAPAPAAPLDPTKYISKDRISEDPFSVLSELGISYDKLVELAVNAPKPEEVAQQQAFKKLEAEIKSLKDAQDGAKKNFDEVQKRNYDQAVNQIRVETRSLINNNPDFETIKETGSGEDVVDLIKQTFDKDGILLTVEEAAKEVEEHLIEEAMKISRIKKIQQRLSAAKPAAPKQETTVNKQTQPTKTLTNAIGGSRQLSARERAIAAFKGELK